MKIILIGSFIFLLFNSLEAEQNRYRLYCFYTPQFQTLYENHFLPSLKDDFEIVAKQFEQECPSGLFHSAGWNKTMLRKLEMLREAILDHWDRKIFFYSDIDIVFLQPILQKTLEYLGDRDLVAQQAWPRPDLCAGFLVIRGCDKTLKLVDEAIELMERRGCPDDQTALNIVLKNTPISTLVWELLPPSQFPNGKRVLKGYCKGSKQNYAKGVEIAFSSSALLFHANCCIGLDNKIAFLLQVQEEYQKLQN